MTQVQDGPGLPRTSEEVLSMYAAAGNRRPGTPRSGRSGADSGGGLIAMLAACGR
jgi:hypothetical protein